MTGVTHFGLCAKQVLDTCTVHAVLYTQTEVEGKWFSSSLPN